MKPKFLLQSLINTSLLFCELMLFVRKRHLSALKVTIYPETAHQTFYSDLRRMAVPRGTPKGTDVGQFGIRGLAATGRAFFSSLVRFMFCGKDTSSCGARMAFSNHKDRAEARLSQEQKTMYYMI